MKDAENKGRQLGEITVRSTHGGNEDVEEGGGSWDALLKTYAKLDLKFVGNLGRPELHGK